MSLILISFIALLAGSYFYIAPPSPWLLSKHVEGHKGSLSWIVVPLIFFCLSTTIVLKSKYSPERETTGSSEKKQNREIPGYSDCIEDIFRTNPNAPQRTCCDRVGGSWSQTGTFGTCEK